jgi:hypothetical protein
MTVMVGPSHAIWHEGLVELSTKYVVSAGRTVTARDTRIRLQSGISRYSVEAQHIPAYPQ